MVMIRVGGWVMIRVGVIIEDKARSIYHIAIPWEKMGYNPPTPPWN